MNWITKMFQERPEVVTLTPENKMNGLGTQDIMNVPENLFIDHLPPDTEERDHAEPLNTINIESFLDQDFFNKGYKDGYDYHTMDTLQLHIKSIKTDFRIKLDLLIDLKRGKIRELKSQQIEVKEMSDRLFQQIGTFLMDLAATIERLESEKELSACDEGWIMKPIHNYRDGFYRGLDMYHEEKLIGMSTGLFN